MRIGFDISQTGSFKAGTGFFAYSLIHTLAEIDTQNEYILYPTFGDFYFDRKWSKSVTKIRKPNFHQGLAHHTLEEAGRFWGAPPPDFEKQLENPQIIQSNNFYCPLGFETTKLVYVLYDLAFISEPDKTTEANRIGCFFGVLKASLYADHIISISKYSRDHFLKVFPYYPSERITVVPLASRFTNVRVNATTKPPGLPSLKPDQFWLNAGTLEPRKNQIRLLKAYAKLKSEVGNTYPLVFAGGSGWLMETFDMRIDELGLVQDIIKLGYVDEQQLQWLYQNCFAFIFPSLFEGFGLPVLEAMSQGAAVITSNTTSLPEVAGDATLLVDPLQEDSIFEAMNALIEEEVSREKLKSKAYIRAKQYSWEKTAYKTIEVYRSLV